VLGIVPNVRTGTCKFALVVTSDCPLPGKLAILQTLAMGYAEDGKWMKIMK